MTDGHLKFVANVSATVISLSANDATVWLYKHCELSKITKLLHWKVQWTVVLETLPFVKYEESQVNVNFCVNMKSKQVLKFCLKTVTASQK